MSEELDALLVREWELWSSMSFKEKRQGSSDRHKEWERVRAAIRAIDPSIDLNDNHP